jgi:two-component system, OmpR family, sensor histidine kinase BaeS
MRFKRKNKLATKLGFLFLTSILLLEGSLFAVLYFGFLNERVMVETDALVARGNSHSDVLEKHFDRSTRGHVALMESEAETQVVITDDQSNILDHSNAITPAIRNTIQSADTTRNDGGIVEGDWAKAPFVSTVSPVMVNGAPIGYVYM